MSSAVRKRKKTIYQVVVHGSVLFESTDFNLSHFCAHCYRLIGWQRVLERKIRK